MRFAGAAASEGGSEAPGPRKVSVDTAPEPRSPRRAKAQARVVESPRTPKAPRTAWPLARAASKLLFSAG